MNIYEKLSAITIELLSVAKNLEVGVGKSSYKAVGEADVLRAVKPLEAKYKVYSYPFSRRIIESGTLENEAIDYNTKEKITKKNLFERIETIYRFVNTEQPDEYVDIVSYGDGIDPQDKSVGKAMTYADKYALLKAYKIITGDDPDQDLSKDLKDVKTKKPPVLETTKAQDLPFETPTEEAEIGELHEVVGTISQTDKTTIYAYVNGLTNQQKDVFYAWLNKLYFTRDIAKLSERQGAEIVRKIGEKQNGK